MTTHQSLVFLLFAVVAAVTPGPSNLILTAVGANGGIIKGLPSLLGVTAGMGLMLFLVPLGLGNLILRLPVIQVVLHWGGAAFLLWMSWKIATSSRTASLPQRVPVGLLSTAGFQWVNPKSWLVAVGAAGTFLNTGGGNPVAQAAVFSGLFFLAALPSCFLWLAAGASLQHVLRNHRRLRIFNLTMGLLLALSVLLILR